MEKMVEHECAPRGTAPRSLAGRPIAHSEEDPRPRRSTHASSQGNVSGVVIGPLMMLRLPGALCNDFGSYYVTLESRGRGAAQYPHEERIMRNRLAMSCLRTNVELMRNGKQARLDLNVTGESHSGIPAHRLQYHPTVCDLGILISVRYTRRREALLTQEIISVALRWIHKCDYQTGIEDYGSRTLDQG